MKTFEEILKASMNDKKGVQVFVSGHAIAGVVTGISEDILEMRSREYSRIAVRLDQVAAVAMS